jgi:ABC transporter substrate binding protein (PQQ-dependent alcohol dehydrogenase system)
VALDLGAPRRAAAQPALRSRGGAEHDGGDWAAWAAVKAVVEAIIRTEATAVEAIRAYLTSDSFVLDTYKGNPGSFRPWSHQLRQPILLHTYDAVIERAPLPEFFHATNVLDTLGLDAPETECDQSD